MKHPTEITFFEWLIPFVESGKKTITIRDEAESHYLPGTRVEVHVLETGRKVCDIEIESVQQIIFDDINESHARQEYLPLSELKKLIKKVYPDSEKLFVISYKLIEKHR